MFLHHYISRFYKIKNMTYIRNLRHGSLHTIVLNMYAKFDYCKPQYYMYEPLKFTEQHGCFLNLTCDMSHQMFHY